MRHTHYLIVIDRWWNYDIVKCRDCDHTEVIRKADR